LWGGIWNAKLAARFKCTLKGKKLGSAGPQVGDKRPRDATANADSAGDTDAPCPVCGGPDSGSHIMGSCRHNEMQRLYINRHNRALLCVAKAVSRGCNGAGYMVLDATARDAAPTFAPDNRVPDWMLCEPSKPRLTPAERELADKMRPDLLHIPSLPRASTTSPRYKGPSMQDRRNHPVYIVEFGCCGDLNHEAKIDEKVQQHMLLAARLREAGWTVIYEKQTIITLGFAGSLQKTTGDLLRTLGCHDGQANVCLSQLHNLATKYAAAILHKRRWLEKSTPRTGPGGAPQAVQSTGGGGGAYG